MKYKAKNVLKKIAITLGFFVTLILIYLFTGFGNPNSTIDYIVKVDNDTKLISVEMTILPNRFLFFDLFIDRFRNKNGDLRVSDLKVTRGGKTVAHWKTVPSFSALERLWIGFDRSPIIVSYTIDPFVKKGNRGKMSSYLTDQYGYFRGMYILYTPITFTQTIAFLAKKPIPQNWPGVGTIQFDLPAGWQVNDPWVNNSEKISLADFKNTYWGFCQNMIIIKSENLSIGIIEKLNEDQKTATYQNIIRIYRTIEEITGIQLKQDASFWAVSILPPVPIHGGSSGNYSLLTENSISFISHEIFHWWNGFALKSSNETSWIQEGFTKYYEGKVLLDAGIWSDNDFNKFIANLKKGLWVDGKPQPINLITASNRLNSKGSSVEDYNQVYNGGALLAYYIDQELEKEQKALDQIWLPLFELEKIISSEDFLTILENMTNKTFRNKVNDIIQGQTTIPQNSFQH